MAFSQHTKNFFESVAKSVIVMLSAEAITTGARKLYAGAKKKWDDRKTDKAAPAQQ